MVFSCARCGYETGVKGNLKKHLLTKKECPDHLNCQISREDLLKQFQKTTNPTQCPHCSKSFSCRQAKYNHVKMFCPVLRNTKEHQARQQTRTMQNNQQTTIINNIVVNNNNTVNNSFHINPFGEEDIRHIIRQKNKMDRWVQNDVRGIRDMAKEVWFDPLHPENNTVHLPNVSRSYMKISTGKGQTEIVPAKQVLTGMIEFAGTYLYDYYNDEDNNERLTAWLDERGARKEVEEFFKKLLHYDKDLYTELRTIMFSMAFNNRTCSEATFKTLERPNTISAIGQ